jgi:cholesterol oxidase
LMLSKKVANWADLAGDWRRQGASAKYFTGLDIGLRRFTGEMGGKLREWPLWRFNRSVTVHPLGGCPMGHTSEDGVVNKNGEVFGYPGFFIADGSVLPTPVGANPSLTIAALARHFSCKVLHNHREREREREFNQPVPATLGVTLTTLSPHAKEAQLARLALQSTPKPTSDPELRFREQLHGRLTLCRAGKNLPAPPSSALTLQLQMEIAHLDELCMSRERRVAVAGSAVATLLGGEVQVKRGELRLFPRPDCPYGTTTIEYTLEFDSHAGYCLMLCGHKELTKGSWLKIWRQTTRMNVTLYRSDEGAADPGEPLAKGQVKITLGGIGATLRSFRGMRDWKHSRRATTRFLHFFATELWRTYRGAPKP